MCERHPLWCSADDAPPDTDAAPPPNSVVARPRARAWDDALLLVRRQGLSVREWMRFDRWMRSAAEAVPAMESVEGPPRSARAGDPYGTFGNIAAGPAPPERPFPLEDGIPPECWRTITA